MQVWNWTTVKSLLAPGGVLLLGVAILVSANWLTLTMPALTFLFYCAVIGGMLLAWRFHSSRTFSALLVIFLAQQAVAAFEGSHSSPGTPGWTALQAVSVLVPLNFVLIAFMHERGFTLANVAPVGLLLFVQTVIVAVLCRAPEIPTASHAHHPTTTAALPSYAALAFAVACVLLLLRFLLTRKPVDSALLWSLSGFFLSVYFRNNDRVTIAYAATASCILGASIIENSYLLAYHDELTGLPSRRAFNDALLRLAEPYSIAVVDIDHFKRFNDTYGHDTGDQVLRLVAANLAHVTGGGQAYRCGGEEFSILFPAKAMPEVVDHLELLRATIEASEFYARGIDRRRVPRGPDRRGQRSRARGQKRHAIRQLAQEKPSAPLSVTVSIGLATTTRANPYPDDVLQAADKALYRAKANGRNRLETAPAGRRTRTKAAGIA